MNWIHRQLETYKDLSTVAGILTGLLVILLMFIWFYLPAIKMVWRSLAVKESLPAVGTLAAFWASVWAWPPKPTQFSKRMRLWLELRLLRPRPVREPHWELDRRTKRFRLRIDEKGYQDELRDWAKDIEGKFAALKIGDKEPVIEIRDVFRLNDDATKNGIKEYLLAVDEYNISLGEDASFLCKVRINEGYLLPLNLLGGLMSRFAADWDPIISAYGQMAAKGRFSTVQLSMFDLWLLWGPSVPLCTCDQWLGPVTLQYGFGDENNSVRVRVQGEAKEKILAELKRAADRKHRAYPALHVSITGRLWPPSSFAQGAFCSAQHELVNPDREAFILEYESHALIGNASGSHLFYTAYVWAMFVLAHGAKPSQDAIRQSPWLQVMPFFEHANIVDESTYDMAKILLARKVLTYARQNAMTEVEGQLAPLRLWYLCSIDDSGCGGQLEVPLRGQSIRAAIEELLQQPEFSDLRERFVMDDHSYAETLSGCHLAETVAEYFNTVGAYERGGKSQVQLVS